MFNILSTHYPKFIKRNYTGNLKRWEYQSWYLDERERILSSTFSIISSLLLGLSLSHNSYDMRKWFVQTISSVPVGCVTGICVYKIHWNIEMLLEIAVLVTMAANGNMICTLTQEYCRFKYTIQCIQAHFHTKQHPSPRPPSRKIGLRSIPTKTSLIIDNGYFFPG